MNPVAFYIRNHSSSELLKAELSSLPSISKRPAFTSKDEYAKWCHDAGTDHVFYYLAEPEYPTMRSSGQNPVKFLHGVVADYDGSPDLIKAELAKLKFTAGKAPTYVTTTFSNKARLLWAFEKPVPVFTGEVMEKFMSILAKELDVKRLLPGLDEGAWSNPHTPYELGTDWRQPYGDVRLAHSLVVTAIHDASAKAKFKSDGPVIPMEAIAAEVDRRWPGRWTGPFVEGARGVRFWDAKADNTTGCTLRENGVQAWTGECKFLPWVDVLGTDFVKKYRENRIGGAIDGCYYDGQYYWMRDLEEQWRHYSGQQISRRLAVKSGLSTEVRRGAPSEVSQALTTIEDSRSVDGAFPCLFMADEIVRDGRKKFLNISRVQTLPTDAKPRQWGEGFPWLAAYIDGLFNDELKQRDVFLSWVGHFYNHARVGRPMKGHALFVAGPVSAGKTFLSQFIIGKLMGGHSEASDYMLANTSFNEDLFSAPIWTVDDATMAAGRDRHEMYSQMVKKFVANPYQQYHPKFRKAVTFRFNGRLIVTMNDDPKSVKMLPDIEVSMLDKVVILKAGKPGTDFRGAESKALAELPAFADYLANWKTPAWLLTKGDEGARFGFDAWHHPELIETARDSSSSAGVKELLEMWRPLWFRKSDKLEWSGTATELLVELRSTESIASLVDRVAYSRNALGAELQNLHSQNVAWVGFRRSSGVRQYTISRPENTPLKK